MSPRSIRLLRLAKEDLREAYLWYGTQGPGLGADFVAEVVSALRKAAENPLIFPMVIRDREFWVRRILIKRFPYKAFFTAEDDGIVVHAIIHAARSNKAWMDRIR